MSTNREPEPARDRPRGRAPQDATPSARPADDLDDEAEADIVVVVTFFDNYAAATKREQSVALDELARRIQTTTGPNKGDLPWLKLARFGDRRTEKNSLRWDGNLLAVTGCEADYDGERLGFDAAVEKLRATGILCIVYTSPSHTEDTPRWRVLCIFSQDYPPDQRDRFLARLNGLFGGIFSRESWTRSQSYYFGSVNGNPSHHAVLLDGLPIDLADELDATAIGRPEKPKPAAGNGTNGSNGQHADPAAITDKRIAGKIESLLDNIRDAADGTKYFALRDNAYTIGGYLYLTGWTDEQAVEQCIEALPSAKDWNLARRTAAQAIAAGRLKPLTLEDRPQYASRTKSAPSPPPALEPHGEDTPPPEWDTATGLDGETAEAEEEAEAEAGDDPDPQPTPQPDGDGEGGPPAEGVIELPGDPLITEQVAMEAFVAANSNDLRFNHSAGGWLLWDGHYWKPDQRKLAFAWALKLCRRLAQEIRSKDPSKGRLVVEKVRFSAAVEQAARAMPPLSTAQEDWDADPWLLGTPGGVVDLKTGALRPGERKDMLTKTTAVTPADTADCPQWLAFLAFALAGDATMISFIQRFCGYCLTGLTIEEIILFLFGLAGSGKSTLVETLSGIMGDYAGTVPMEVFTASNWNPKEYYRADMAGKRLLVANEPERGAFWAEAFVKEITGGDKLSGRHPAGRPFKFDPTHKPLLHGNHMPRLRGRSTAMERRLRIAPFNRKPAVPDTGLKAKLRAEWPGILRWMINGCLEWQRDGLQPPGAITAANKGYFDAQDVLARWIEDCCILELAAKERPNKLRTSFNTWAKANGEHEMSGNAFSEAIEQFEGAKLTPERSDGKRWIKGIRLADNGIL